MFAEIDAPGWVIIIGAIGLVVDRILGYLRERARDAKINHVVQQTNGMMKKIEDGAFAKGVKSETDKKEDSPSASVVAEPGASTLREAIDAVPAKTAEKVVEKLKSDPEKP